MDDDSSRSTRLQTLSPLAASIWKQLEDLELFHGVEPMDIASLLENLKPRQLDAGDVLISPQQNNTSVYLVLKGELRVHIDSLDSPPLTLLGRGEPVGEMSMFAGHYPSAYVVANNPVMLLEISADHFWSLIRSTHAFAVNLLFRMAGRVRSGNVAIGASEQRAVVDGLTELHNRRWLDEMLPRLLERQNSQNKPTCIAMVDVDHFKQFNDQHGHLVGDAVLQVVARLLEKNVRPGDMVARYGGEEFSMLLPDTELVTAKAVANRVRESIAGESIQIDDKTLSVTASFGLAQAKPEESMEELVSRADGALYRAKHAGRNRVEVE
ncbi:MAG: GGDEF domain-containing protein [Gammaproteobacteria bacterium]